MCWGFVKTDVLIIRLEGHEKWDELKSTLKKSDFWIYNFLFYSDHIFDVVGRYWSHKESQVVQPINPLVDRVLS